jgi:hypothetical protein
VGINSSSGGSSIIDSQEESKIGETTIEAGQSFDQSPTEAAQSSLKNQPLFVENPIVAFFSNNNQQKYTSEQIFRSQMKLISDTVAKEFFFILEFFDFKVSNKTQ